MKKFTLSEEWKVVGELGEGGFGEVFRVKSGDIERALKIVPKGDGNAVRDALTENLDGMENVIHVIEVFEADEEFRILMPLAEKSLRQYLDEEGGILTIEKSLPVLRDVAEALRGMKGRVTHRDIKPENVLLFEGRWCLSDFGIARLAEAETATDTQKYAHSKRYTAPERWSAVRATNASDVYSFGIMAYEIISGHTPFSGPDLEDYREQHAREVPQSLEGIPQLLNSLILECLIKPMEARPTPENILARLDGAAKSPESEAAARLQKLNSSLLQQRVEKEITLSTKQQEEQSRNQIYAVAKDRLGQIIGGLFDQIVGALPEARVTGNAETGFQIRVGETVLAYSGVKRTKSDVWEAGKQQREFENRMRNQRDQFGDRFSFEPDVPAFDVMAYADISLQMDKGSSHWAGRQHSLWYGDIQSEKDYGWFESGWMLSVFARRDTIIKPFAFEPGAEAAKAILPAMGTHRIDWEFTRLEVGMASEFYGRWIDWFVQACEGTLQPPTQWPERSNGNSWRVR